ncbi:MAG TPA: SDR family NAD(P)-dependent oxidoreductase [Tepidisphaeraceae bacterium]|jgi:NAD(P)-dependent dehydrogenase (short-subunit alcohol dehydrogenase family)
MLELAGSRALVTGGSRGIGLSIAEALAVAGADVVLCHLNDGERAAAEAKRLSAKTGRKISHIDADVGDCDAARAMVAKAAELMGGIDLCISNAGICQFTPFLEIDSANWSKHVATNFSGGFFVTQRAAQLMAEQKTGGRIVFVTSVGAFRSNATQTHYCATKSGLHILAMGMAIELAPFGITVNCIAPGWIHTDINDAASRDTSAVENWIQWNCPAGRLGKPQDCGGAAVFLCSKEASYVTGATITVDGGWNAKL